MGHDNFWGVAFSLPALATSCYQAGPRIIHALFAAAYHHRDNGDGPWLTAGADKTHRLAETTSLTHLLVLDGCLVVVVAVILSCYGRLRPDKLAHLFSFRLISFPDKLRNIGVALRR